MGQYTDRELQEESITLQELHQIGDDFMVIREKWVNGPRQLPPKFFRAAVDNWLAYLDWETQRAFTKEFGR